MKNRSWIWKETAEVLGVLGVIGSLVFVAFEIRQNTEAVRSSTIQSISHWSYETYMAYVENEALRVALQAACDGTMSDDQRRQVGSWYGAILRLQVNRFYQAKLGILDEEATLALGGKGGALRWPPFVEAWAGMKDTFELEFQDYIERQILAQPTLYCP